MTPPSSPPTAHRAGRVRVFGALVGRVAMISVLMTAVCTGPGYAAGSPGDGLPAAPTPSVTPSSTVASQPPAPTTRSPERVRANGAGQWIVDGSLFDLDAMSVRAGETSSFALSLPAGVHADRLLGTVDARVGATSGTVASEAVGRNRVFSLGLAGQPLVSLPAAGEVVSLDLAPAQLDGLGGDTFDLEASSNAVCRAVPDSARLRDVSVAVSTSSAARGVVGGGRVPASSTFADYFPPVLDRMIIAVDPAATSSSATAQAVLDLVAATVHRWPMATVIMTTDDVALSPFDRRIAIRPTGRSGVTLEERASVSTLVLGGPVDALARLSAYVFSAAFDATFDTHADLASIPSAGSRSQASGASGGSSSASSASSGRPASRSGYVTLADLRNGPLSATGFDAVSTTVAVDQARMGGQLAALTSSFTGVARSSASGAVTVQLRANDRILTTKRVSNDEVFELTGTVGPPALAAENVFEVRVSDAGDDGSPDPTRTAALVGNSPDGAQCHVGTTVAAVTLELDPSSSFEATFGPGVPVGFERFPQAFVGGFDVVFDKVGPEQIDSAASLLALLQRTSSALLQPRVRVGAVEPLLLTALNRPSLVVATPKSVPAMLLAAGMAVGGATADNMAKPSRSNATTAVLGAVDSQTGDDQTLDHLLLLSNRSSELASVLAGIAEAKNGIRSLRGDLVVAANGRVKNIRVQPAEIPIRPPRRLVVQARTGYPLRFGFGVGLVIALFVVVSRHRRTS